MKPLYLQRRGDAKEIQQRWEIRGGSGRLPLLELLLVDCGEEWGGSGGVNARLREGRLAIGVLLEISELVLGELALGFAHGGGED